MFHPRSQPTNSLTTNSPHSLTHLTHSLISVAPMIRIVTQVLPVYTGDSVKLECQTESNPLAEHVWQMPNGDRMSSFGAIISVSGHGNNAHRKRHRGRPQDETRRNQTTSNRKYHVSLKKTGKEFRYLFQLHVNHVTHDNAGQYVCELANRMGEARSAILLKGQSIFSNGSCSKFDVKKQKSESKCSPVENLFCCLNCSVNFVNSIVDS